MTTSKRITRVSSINRAKIEADATCGLPDGTRFDLTNAGTLIVHDGPFVGKYRTVKVKSPRWLGDYGYTFSRIDANHNVIVLWDITPRTAPEDTTPAPTTPDAPATPAEATPELGPIAESALTHRNPFYRLVQGDRIEFYVPYRNSQVRIFGTVDSIGTEKSIGQVLARILPEFDSRYPSVTRYKASCKAGDFIRLAPIEAAEAAATPEQEPVVIEAAPVDVVAVKTAELIDKAPVTPRPITDAMVEQYPMLAKIALRFVAEYTGTNSFVQDIAVKLADTGNLSIGQMRGALNVMIAEARIAKRQEIADMKDYASKYGDASGLIEAYQTPASAFHIDLGATIVDDARKAGKLDGNALDRKIDADMRLAGVTPTHGETMPVRVPNGTYTVPINDGGDYRVIKLTDCPERYNKPAGTQIAAYQSGPDNDADYTGFAFVTGANMQLWRKFHSAIQITHALNKLLTLGKAQEFGKLWAMTSERCYICGRTLTTPLSKAAGIGPDCADANGISQAALALMGTKAGAIEENDNRDAQAKIDDLFD